MSKLTVQFRSLFTDYKCASNLLKSVKCLAFLKAEEPISHYYTFGQNNYTSRPLADKNDMKSRSTDFSCQDDIHNVIAAFPDIIPSYITTSFLSLQFAQATERRVN